MAVANSTKILRCGSHPIEKLLKTGFDFVEIIRRRANRGPVVVSLSTGRSSNRFSVTILDSVGLRRNGVKGPALDFAQHHFTQAPLRSRMFASLILPAQSGGEALDKKI